MQPEITIVRHSEEKMLQGHGLDGLLKHIELCGRVCYKSEDRITMDSAEKFVKMLCSRGHTAATEHGTLYFTWPQGIADSGKYDIIYSRFSHNNYDDNNIYVTTNFRVVFEACDKDYDKTIAFIQKHAVEPTDQHEKRISFRIICDRGVTHELVRHRVFSFAQESTRYVSYGTKQPFRFIEPSWWQDKMEGDQYTIQHEMFLNLCKNAAETYQGLLQLGQSPQQARAVLPNAIKTEIVMTGTIEQWKGMLELRTAPAAHPDMQPVALSIQEQLGDALTD